VLLAIYVLVDGNRSGWTSVQTLAFLAGASVLLGLFIGIEARARAPLMPLGLFRLRNVAVANAASALSAAALLGWSVIATLYLQVILGLSPLEVGWTFMPAMLLTGVTSLGVAPTLIARFGVRPPLVIGLLFTGTGLALLARAPADGSVGFDVLPSMVLIGVGVGMAHSPLMLSALGSVSPREYGAASGICRVSSAMGGAVGFAVLASLAAARTEDLLRSGADVQSALQGGYRVAFALGAVFAIIAALSCAAFIRTAEQPRPRDRETGDAESAQNVLNEMRS
jgi:MFS family permease